MPKSDPGSENSTQNEIANNSETPSQEVAAEDDFLASGPDIPISDTAFRKWKDSIQAEKEAQAQAQAEAAQAAQDPIVGQGIPQFPQNGQFGFPLNPQMQPMPMGQGAPISPNGFPNQYPFGAPNFAQMQGFPQPGQAQPGQAQPGQMQPGQAQPDLRGFETFPAQMQPSGDQGDIDSQQQTQQESVQAESAQQNAVSNSNDSKDVSDLKQSENVEGDADDAQPSASTEPASTESTSTDSASADSSSTPSSEAQVAPPASGAILAADAKPVSPAITSPQPPAVPQIPEQFKQHAADEKVSEPDNQSGEAAISQTLDKTDEEAPSQPSFDESSDASSSVAQQTAAASSSSAKHQAVEPAAASSAAQPGVSEAATPVSDNAPMLSAYTQEVGSTSFDLPLTSSQFRRVEFDSDVQGAQDASQMGNTYTQQPQQFGEYTFQDYSYQQMPDGSWAQNQDWQYQGQPSATYPQNAMSEPYPGYQQDLMISQYAAASAIEPMQQMQQQAQQLDANAAEDAQGAQNFDYQSQYGAMPMQDYEAYAQQGYSPDQDMQQAYYQQYPYQGYAQPGYYDPNYMQQNAYGQQPYDQNAYNLQGYDFQGYPQQQYDPQQYGQQTYDPEQYNQQAVNPQDAQSSFGQQADMGQMYSQDPYGNQQYAQAGYDQQGLDQASGLQQQYQAQNYQDLGYSQQGQPQYADNANAQGYYQGDQGDASAEYSNQDAQGVAQNQGMEVSQAYSQENAMQPQANQGYQQEVGAPVAGDPQLSGVSPQVVAQTGVDAVASPQLGISEQEVPQQGFDAQVIIQQGYPSDAEATQAVDPIPQQSADYAQISQMRQAGINQVTSEYAAAMAAGMVQPGIGATGNYADYANAQMGGRRLNGVGPAQNMRNGAAHGSGRKKMSGFKKTLLIIGGALICVIAICAVGIGLYLGGINSNLQSGLDEDVMGALAEPTEDNQAFYTLILGSDTRQEGGGGRSDTIILARIDPETQEVSLVSIPRDTQVQLQGHGTQKINAAYAYGGTSGAITAVSELAGVPISHVVEVDFSGFKEIVDALGGVTVNVPKNTHYEGVSIPEGKQTLNGDQALVFVRCRKGYASGDYQRADNQRQLISAIVKKTLNSSVLEMTNIINSITKSLSTDMSVTDIVALATSLRGMNTDDMITAVMPSHTGSQGGVSYVFVEEPAWSEMMEIINAGGDPNESSSSSSKKSSKSSSSSADGAVIEIIEED